MSERNSHHHHHHHHHHRHGGDDDYKMSDIFDEYMNVGSGSKRTDTTSQFRDFMRKRRLRKMIVTRVIWTLGVILALLIMCAVVYAYIFDR